MSEKVRGAIFGVLGDIKGLTALDAFSGSGAIAIEAVSRGAKSAVAVEMDRTAQKVTADNIAALGIEDRVKSVRASVKAWSTRHQAETFDLIFADPPYDTIPYRDVKSLPGHLKDGGTLVLSWPGKAKALTFEGLQVAETKNYGDAQLVFYQKIS
jgi:16S rRNA (guanine966-N2)-methyltransferase